MSLKCGFFMLRKDTKRNDYGDRVLSKIVGSEKEEVKGV
jgi:hypothetical protein